MNRTTKETAVKILETLERRKFAEWYNRGRFDSYITGEYPAGHHLEITKEMILEDIVKLFRLE